jgi:5-methylcytosine-specific restriction endonuclease McrA
MEVSVADSSTAATAPSSAPDEAQPAPAQPAAFPNRDGGERGRRSDSNRVLVLNSSYEPLNVCTVRRAVVLLLKDKAECLEIGKRQLHSESMTLPHPVVIRLVSYVRVPRDSRKRKITRRAVFARDSWTCQYCGQHKPGLTVDHVIPRSRGGESVWENIVAACASCNRRKGNRLPREASMHPKRRPRPPGPLVFIRISSPRIPNTWERYLVAA